MVLTQEQKDKAFRLFYGEDKNLGEIAAEFGCGIWDLSPWIYQSATRAARKNFAEGREEGLEKGKRDANAARAYVAEAIASFDGDPADSDFQLGYLAALRVVGREALGMDIPDPELPIGERRSRPKFVVHEGGKL